MILETFPVGPLQCNCTILGDEAAGKAVVIDPGGDLETILARLKKQNLKAVLAVHTHAHFDHIGASRPLKEATGAALALHAGDLWLYENIRKQGEAFGFELDETLPLDRRLADGDEAAAGGVRLEVLHTPGHTPGSVCFSLPAAAPVLFSGDTLFRRGIGRTDLWGGDTDAILKSIRTRLLALPDETRVIPGHGPATTIGEERRENLFLEE